MIIKCISTGSKGNCYFLKSNITNKILILDLGVNYNSIIGDKFLNYNISNVVGCLVTHEHKDHTQALKQMKMSGIKIIDYVNVKTRNIYKFENFSVMAIPLFHDVDCYGYIIRDDSSGEMLFYGTDTYKLPLIKGIDYWLVECNYIDEILEKNLCDYQHAQYQQVERLYRTHMSLENLYNYFEVNKELIKEPKQILTIHSSNSGHFNKDIVINKLSNICKNSYVVMNNKEYILNKEICIDESNNKV